MRKGLFTLLAVMITAIQGMAQTTTYTNRIADIIYDHCSTCHRSGEIAPFALTNYDEVKSYGPTIKYVTEIRYMPPWKANPKYSHFLDENYLTDDEISAIGEWVENGMPYGDQAEEPTFPIFPDGSALGTPDLVLEMSEAYVHGGDNRDEYRYFVLPTGLTEDKKVKAIELRPGNRRIVHHALFFQDTEGKAAEFDARTPEYGFNGTSGFTIDDAIGYNQFPGYVPGQKPRYYPEGMGQSLDAGSDLVIQMHYAPVNATETDRSKVNIFFADEDEEITREVSDYIMLPFNLTTGAFSFYMSPGEVKKFVGEWNITEDISMVGIFPHMHLLGKDWKVWLETPDGKTTNLIEIEDWDFNWQGGYYFPRFMVAPAGSKVVAEATYDNTADNPSNPSNPPVFVSWGEKTTDEMYYLPILHVPYQEGDENIVFDNVLDTEEQPELSRNSKINTIYPQPAKDDLIHVDFTIDQGQPLTITLFDLNGRKIKQLRQNEYFSRGNHLIHCDASQYSSGTYIFSIKGPTVRLSQPIIIGK